MGQYLTISSAFVSLGLQGTLRIQHSLREGAQLLLLVLEAPGQLFHEPEGGGL